ncbi:phosphatase PAP2 family protein [Costertonia aggregata]|uniref:Phosphatase PAP2 family protein n=1 Tax=Costertonia aggregata TaxID=343403 RepID=A0A7H9ASB2_9FLAO|nr:phosphatase PAP2 family protein [Costertonia aggregata]QLG46344.1 phosphatase PAP2 family protein [Costertonia aggregata]
MLEELIKYDKELFLFLNNLGNPTFDGFWMFVTNKLYAIPLYFLLFILTFKRLGAKKTLLFLVFVALLITATDQLSNFFKYCVGRLRPCHDETVFPFMRLVKSYCGGKFGYFSAHAANAFAVAFFFIHVLGSKFRYIRIFLVFWAFFVAYSRIYIGVHFPLDVLTGALIGLIFSWLFAKLYIFALYKFPI